MRSCAEPAGEVESKGVELEVAGRLARNWQVSAGYTYTSAGWTMRRALIWVARKDSSFTPTI